MDQIVFFSFYSIIILSATVWAADTPTNKKDGSPKSPVNRFLKKENDFTHSITYDPRPSKDDKKHSQKKT